MASSQKRIQNRCIEVLAENWGLLWKPCSHSEQSDDKRSSDEDTQEFQWGGRTSLQQDGRLEWRDPDLFLHSYFADCLLEEVSRRGQLDDRVLSTFTPTHTRLCDVRMVTSREVTNQGLKVLEGHSVTSLDIGPSIKDAPTMRAVLQSVTKSSSHSLHLLKRGDTLNEHGVWDDLFETEPQFVVDAFRSLVNLRVLDISGTRLRNQGLAVIARSALCLQTINLANNPCVSDITPLTSLTTSMHWLGLHAMVSLDAQRTLSTLRVLTLLTHLDLSLRVTYSRCFRRGHPKWRADCKPRVHWLPRTSAFCLDTLLLAPSVGPHLQFLDLSGRTTLQAQLLGQFVDAHPSLDVLGLWGTETSQFMLHSRPGLQFVDAHPSLEVLGLWGTETSQFMLQSRPGLSVIGHSAPEQYMAALSHHSTDKDYVILVLSDDVLWETMASSQDDGVIQALLDTLATKGRSWRLYSTCLSCIFMLLKKNIVQHVQPATQERLRQLCMLQGPRLAWAVNDYRALFMQGEEEDDQD